MRRQGSKSAIDSPARRRLPLLLRRAWYGLNKAFRRRIAHLGVTTDQITVMRTLTEAEGLAQRALALAMTSDANTIASLMTRMERAGLLARQRHEKDRRAQTVRLSTVGRRKYGKARRIAVALQAEVLRALGPTSQETFLRDLEIVADACREAAGEGRPGSSYSRKKRIEKDTAKTIYKEFRRKIGTL